MTQPAQKAPPKSPNYSYTGPFDRAAFLREFSTTFSKSPRYRGAAIPDLLALVGLIESDTLITDIRWMAYMLATVYWETTVPIAYKALVHNRKGKVVRNKQGQPIMCTKRKWQISMAPVDEVGHGKGRNYHDPVKVKRLPDGSAQITEQDGDQFRVSSAGVPKALTKGAKMGSVAGAGAVDAYDEDDGTENAYFGRGYVQLTWWSNYAKAGVALGRGLDLLLDPELVKEPAVAYKIMSHGMRTGAGFANGRKFIHYFNATKTSYTSARAMVNGSDHQADIAKIARQFEAILFKSEVSHVAASK